VRDALVVRYTAGAERYLPLHTHDASFTLTIALNPKAEFTGGGTYFEERRTVISPDVGHVVAFRGDQPHGAEPLTAGTRYVIACHLFLVDEVAPAWGCKGKQPQPPGWDACKQDALLEPERHLRQGELPAAFSQARKGTLPSAEFWDDYGT
jgi:hypothetical protein